MLPPIAGASVMLSQQLRDAKQKAAPARRPDRNDHEDILEGLEREYASAMVKLQSAHEREMLLSSRVGDLQNKLQVRVGSRVRAVRCTRFVIGNSLQAAQEQVASLNISESELKKALQQTQVRLVLCLLS